MNKHKLHTEEYRFQNSHWHKVVSISVLNDDCMRHIFSFLSFHKRLQLQRVCKKWQILMPCSGVKKLRLGEEEIICDAVRISKFSIMALKKILNLCGFSITSVKIDYFQDKACGITILKLIKKLCPKLSSMDLGNFELHRQAAGFITSNFNTLRVITIGDGSDEDKIAKFFLANKNLRTVKFNNCRLQGNCLSTLPLHLIEEFGIFDSEDFSFTNIKRALLQMNNLRILGFSSNLSVIENSDKLLKAVPNKSILDNLCIDATLFFYDIGTVQINSLANFTNLKKLYLSGSAIVHNETLSIIGHNCKQLEVAFLSVSFTLTDVGWKNFAKLQNLKQLKLSELWNLSCDSLLCLHVSSLEVLICHKIDGLTNESLHDLLKRAIKLRKLDITSCNLVNINTLVKVASVEAESRPKNEVIELRVKIDRVVHGILKNISSQLIVQNSDCVS